MIRAPISTPIPLDKVGEIHLGGHDEDEDDHGKPLLIDSHGQPEIVDPVWALLDHTLARCRAHGRVLIEWDNDVPDLGRSLKPQKPPKPLIS